MWILRRISEQECENDLLQFYMLPGRHYVVGRKDCDIVIPGDATVSRKHAVIRVAESEENGSYLAYIKDTSKTGILLNGNKIAGNSDIATNHGDTVSFGKMHIRFKFLSVNFKAVTSGISKAEEKSKLKSGIKKLGGVVLSEWNVDATHLIMNKIVFTIKVVCALACGKHIVTPKFFDDLLDCVDQKKGIQLPEERHYLPTVAEPTMLSQEALFLPNQQRASLLTGKVFVFLTAKQRDRMKGAIEFAGGETRLHQHRDKNALRNMASSQLLFVQVESKELNETQDEDTVAWIRDVEIKLKGHSLRPLQESEIGVAILHTSLNEFCNPTITEVPTLCSTRDTQLSSDSQGTQTRAHRSSAIRKTTANQEGHQTRKNQMVENQNKRKRDVSLGDVTPEKRIKAEPQQQKSAERKTSSKNIIEVDDDSDSEFLFEDTATGTQKQQQQQTKILPSEAADVSRQQKQKKPDTSKKLVTLPIENYNRKDMSVVIPNTEFISDVEKSAVVTPSKKPIPDTAPSNANSCRNHSIIDDFDQLDEDIDPFVFDIPVLSTTNPSRLEKNKGDSSEDNYDAKPSAKFLKAVNDTQELHEEEIFISDSEGNLVPQLTGETTTRMDSSSSDAIIDETMISKADGTLRKQSGSVMNSPEVERQQSCLSEHGNRILKTTDHGKQSRNSGKRSSRDFFTKGIEKRVCLNESDNTNMIGEITDNDVMIVNDRSKKKPHVAKEAENLKKEVGDPTKEAGTDLSYLLYDDDDGNVKNVSLSDDFPVVSNKRPVILGNGWLSTTSGKIHDDAIMKEEEDPDMVDLPKDLMQTRFEVLISKVTVDNNKNLEQKHDLHSINLRNTKRFRKQIHPGWSNRNSVIRSTDLVVFTSNDEKRSNMFDTFREEYDCEEEDDQRVQKMFEKVSAK